MIKLCSACGTSYETAGHSPEQCNICDDERQYVPLVGQKWTDFYTLMATHANKWQQHDAGLFSIKTVPAFAINQRAFLLRTDEGNILWDCIANLDDATRALVDALGGLKAIAISHPHYYTTMQDWAEAFNAPLYLHASDSEWIMRESPHIKLWKGDSLRLFSDVTLMRLGGHFAGGSVLHWAQGEGTLLAGDIVQVTPGADAVSFMWSYPNMLPLSAHTVGEIACRLSKVKFSRLFGAFEGQNIQVDADTIVQYCSEKYISCLKRA